MHCAGGTDMTVAGGPPNGSSRSVSERSLGSARTTFAAASCAVSLKSRIPASPAMSLV